MGVAPSANVPRLPRAARSSFTSLQGPPPSRSSKSQRADARCPRAARSTGMVASYLPYEPDQDFLPSPSLSEWLPEGHLAYFISDSVDALDLTAFRARYEAGGPRNQPFHPAMMGKVLLCAYAMGVQFTQGRSKAARGRGLADHLRPVQRWRQSLQGPRWGWPLERSKGGARRERQAGDIRGRGHPHPGPGPATFCCPRS